MIRRAAILAGAIIGFLALGMLIFTLLELYLAEPLDRLYQTALNLARLAPQDWLWALLIALVILFSLRTITGRRHSSEENEPITEISAENLSSWLVLLQERDKGPYFRWRVANRLAELSERIGSKSIESAPEEIQLYLQTGRSRRTIGRDKPGHVNDPPIEEVVSHLEWSVKSEQQG